MCSECGSEGHTWETDTGPLCFTCCDRQRLKARRERDEARNLAREIVDDAQLRTGGEMSYHDYLDRAPWLE
jgi:hypothetical protein